LDILKELFKGVAVIEIALLNQVVLICVVGVSIQKQYKAGLTCGALAEKAKKQIAMGEHPARKKALQDQVPMMSSFIHNRYLPFVKGYKKSWKCDAGLLRKHIEPIWGRRYLDQITKTDVIALMAEHRTTHAPGSCNRLLILLRYLFSLPKKWDIPGVPNNPTTGIPLMKEDNVKERYLSTAEAQKLYEVTDPL
jgi:hypothetical protein